LILILQKPAPLAKISAFWHHGQNGGRNRKVPPVQDGRCCQLVA
jgi:hypothetical protein